MKGAPVEADAAGRDSVASPNGDDIVCMLGSLGGETFAGAELNGAGEQY